MLVGLLLEYNCAVWDPSAYLQKDINKLESVQRLACKICIKNWSAPYRDHLHILGIPTTCDRRMFLKLSTIYYQTVNNSFSFL